MKNTINEKISACLDDELDRFGSRRVVGELLSSEECKQRYLDYRFIGDVLRNEVPALLDANFAQNIMRNLPEDQVFQPEQGGSEEQFGTESARVNPGVRSIWVRPAAGFALAASVTAITLFGLNSFQPVEVDSALPVPVASLSTPLRAPVSNVLPLGNNTVPVSAQSVSVSSSGPSSAVATLETPSQIRSADVSVVSSEVKTLKMEQPFLRNYLATHTEYAAPRGTLSQVRLVGYRSEPTKTAED